MHSRVPTRGFQNFQRKDMLLSVSTHTPPRNHHWRTYEPVGATVSKQSQHIALRMITFSQLRMLVYASTCKGTDITIVGKLWLMNILARVSPSHVYSELRAALILDCIQVHTCGSSRNISEKGMIPLAPSPWPSRLPQSPFFASFSCYRRTSSVVQLSVRRFPLALQRTHSSATFASCPLTNKSLCSMNGRKSMAM